MHAMSERYLSETLQTFGRYTNYNEIACLSMQGCTYMVSNFTFGLVAGNGLIGGLEIGGGAGLVGITGGLTEVGKGGRS
jgi:hypothetical protein